jgi:outer membrane biosynthesis protein TonB
MRHERLWLAGALVFSLLLHAALLSLDFGAGLGLPGLAFPWQQRRAEVPDIQLVLAPAAATAAQAMNPISLPGQEPVVPAAAQVQASPAAAERAAPVEPAAVQVDSPTPSMDVPAASPVAPAGVRRMADTGEGPSALHSEPDLMAMERLDAAALRVAAMPRGPAGELVAAPAASSPATSPQDGRQAALQAARFEAQRQVAAAQEAERAAVARAEVLAQAAARQEAARQEAARQEAARQEAARQEAARQEASRQERARQEVARQQAAKEAARQDELRSDAAAEARRQERLRAIGRQLDEEAAQRDAAAAAAAAAAPTRPLLAASPLRRGRLFGLADPDTDLILYAQAWARKIQLNQTFELVREAAMRPHVDPLVTVAVRSDGSIESVSFVRSSGVAELDEAIRRVVQSQLPYQPFSPALAREYDVIEIRRSWHFDMAIRLH